MERGEARYTTGQVSRRTGITVRTLRFYDSIGLLAPSAVDPAKGRLYSEADVAVLSHIQTLKYIGLSLEEIKRTLRGGASPEGGLFQSLQLQKELLAKRSAHLAFAVKALREAVALLEDSRRAFDWDALAGVIEQVELERDWLEQYQTPGRLRKRITLYDKYSVNPIGWHRWFFERLGDAPELRVLEVGCGDGALWARNRDRIPASWRVTLIDASVGMIEEAKAVLGGISQIKCLVADAQSLPFHDEQFDVVIANHMLYHVPDIPAALSEAARVMKPGASLFASTMSKRHLAEIERIALDFDPGIRVLDPVMERFSLDNGAELLSRHFARVETARYDDRLEVDEAGPLLEYMTSTPMNAKDVLTGRTLERFRAYLDGLFRERGRLTIAKDLGFFQAKKLMH